jgi:hypothetical protein
MDKRNLDQFRHNLGVVNTADTTLRIRLRYGSISELPQEHPVYDRWLEIPPNAVRQFNIESLFPIVPYIPAYIRLHGDQPAAVWISMVDNKTGDASAIPFSFFDMESNGGYSLTIPAVMRGAGGHGTQWQTDGYGVFYYRVMPGSAQFPTVHYHPSTPACTPVTMKLQPSSPLAGFTGLPFWYTVFEDLAKQTCPNVEESNGALEIETASWMSMVSRTYTTRADGGTYGDILPLYPNKGWKQRHFAGVDVRDGFRINAGLHNGMDTKGTWLLQLFRSDGTLAAERTLSLEGRASVQGPLSAIMNAEVPDGLYGLSITTVEGTGAWPWLSLVDNKTGDPTNFW